MTILETVTQGLLGLVAIETSYLAYKKYRGERKRHNNEIFVDTSVLMDGRILSVAEAGFIPGQLVIPRSVIGELQLLADTGDSDKREKARQGLDVLKQLQSLDHIDVAILQDGSRASEGVDERLLAHAKSSGGSLATIDFNLNKVAAVENIRVLNINELARNLRMTYLPGEQLRIDLTTSGTDSHQAVGHLTDGTMVVVEHAKKYIGRSVDIEVIRSLQTAAGRMMFARLARTEQQQSQASSNRNQKVRTYEKPTKEQMPISSEDTRQSRNNKNSSPVPSKRSPEKSSAVSNISGARKNQAERQAPRHRTSKQREESFIELIDKQ